MEARTLVWPVCYLLTTALSFTCVWLAYALVSERPEILHAPANCQVVLWEAWGQTLLLHYEEALDEPEEAPEDEPSLEPATPSSPPSKRRPIRYPSGTAIPVRTAPTPRWRRMDALPSGY